MTGIKMKTPELRGRHGSRPSTAEANEQSPSLVNADEEHLSFHHLKAAFKQPPFPRDQYGSPCHDFHSSSHESVFLTMHRLHVNTRQQQWIR
ncbi:unnamed protein product [Leuciscus chuanchicus]